MFRVIKELDPTDANTSFTKQVGEFKMHRKMTLRLKLPHCGRGGNLVQGKGLDFVPQGIWVKFQ